MLKIRQEQMDILAQIPQREFLRKMLVHVTDFFPDECEKIGASNGASNLEKFVQDGIANAGGYGIESRADVAQFLNLQLMFGADFDRECSWARAILSNASITFGGAKIMLLNEAAMQDLPQNKFR